jgi:hypothetical protein
LYGNGKLSRLQNNITDFLFSKNCKQGKIADGLP